MNANVSWCEITFILQNVHHRCVIQSLQQMTNDQRCYLVSRRHFNSATKWPRTILNAPPSLFYFDIISTVAPLALNVQKVVDFSLKAAPPLLFCNSAKEGVFTIDATRLGSDQKCNVPIIGRLCNHPLITGLVV